MCAIWLATQCELHYFPQRGLFSTACNGVHMIAVHSYLLWSTLVYLGLTPRFSIDAVYFRLLDWSTPNLLEYTEINLHSLI